MRRSARRRRIQADSDAVAVARVNGITTVGVMPAGGLIGGQIAVMNLDGWTWEDSALKPVVGVSFQFPTSVAAGGGGGGGGGQQPARAATRSSSASATRASRTSRR